MLYALVAVAADYHALLLHTYADDSNDSWRKIFELFRTRDPLFLGMSPPVKPGIYVFVGGCTIKPPKSWRIDAIVDWQGDWEEATEAHINRFRRGLRPFRDHEIPEPVIKTIRPRPPLELLQGERR